MEAPSQTQWRARAWVAFNASAKRKAAAAKAVDCHRWLPACRISDAKNSDSRVTALSFLRRFAKRLARFFDVIHGELAGFHQVSHHGLGPAAKQAQ